MAKNELATIDTQIAEIEKVASECSMEALGDLPNFQRTLALSRGMQKLRTLITDDMMADVMALMNSPLGFLTDRDPNKGGKDPYPVDVVRECFIEATLRGYRSTGNEWNIIGGRFYGTREGISARLTELPGFAGLKIRKGVPRPANGGAVVECSATWEMNGKTDSLTAEIPVRVNSGQIVDAVLGKADRKVKALIFEQITGSAPPIGEVGEPDLETMKRVEAAPEHGNEAVKAKLGDLFGDATDATEVPQ